jgi:hypothetical protein
LEEEQEDAVVVADVVADVVVDEKRRCSLCLL